MKKQNNHKSAMRCEEYKGQEDDNIIKKTNIKESSNNNQHKLNLQSDSASQKQQFPIPLVATPKKHNKSRNLLESEETNHKPRTVFKPSNKDKRSGLKKEGLQTKKKTSQKISPSNKQSQSSEEDKMSEVSSISSIASSRASQKNKRKKKNKKIKKSTFLSMKGRLLYSLIMGFLISFFRGSQQPEINQNSDILDSFEHSSVLEITTDRIKYNKTFSIKNQEAIWDGWLFGATSTKKATINSEVRLTFGYKVLDFTRISDEGSDEHNQAGLSRQINNIHNFAQDNYEVQLGSLEVLSFDFRIINIHQRQNGFINSWELEDYEQIKQYFKKEKLPGLIESKMHKIEKDKKCREQIVADFLLSRVSTANQFQMLVRKIDGYTGGILQNFLPDYKIITQRQNNKKSQEDEQDD